MSDRILEYLAEDESVRERWQGKIGRGSDETTFAATDRRLVYLTDGTDFKDISYEHIKSVESEEDDTPSLRGVGIAIGIFGLLGALAGVAVLDAVTFIAGLLLLGIVLLANEADIDNASEKKQKITVIMGENEEENLEFKTDTTENVGAVLSRAIRQ